jgi:hypothetical protein
VDERLEYEAAAAVVGCLTDVRFKLLALVPTLAGAVVALAPSGSGGVELLAIGLLGGCATTGVVLYELRNSEMLATAVGRMMAYEAQHFAGGALAVTESRAHRQTLGIALVYTSALAGWTYLVAWGALEAAGASHAQSIGLAIGAASGVAAAVVLRRQYAPEAHLTRARPGAAG